MLSSRKSDADNAAGPLSLGQMHYRIVSSPEAVTQLLLTLRQDFETLQADRERDGTWELVLAEVLNNVVEHAYEWRATGWIDVRSHDDGTHFGFSVSDHGKAFPNNILPTAKVQDLSGPRTDLPEGGFGLYMVQALAKNLCYERKDDRNILTFSLPWATPPQD